ncbi:MAG: DUF4145 domain-containing protein [Rhodospirillaceae bacterium]|nr:DUF4145 domain-containing protein [Rhodospirillaceae bacterium]
MADTQLTQIKVFCPCCGGERNHNVLAKVESPNPPFSLGYDRYYIVECAGCENTAFFHEFGPPWVLEYDPVTGEASKFASTSRYPACHQRQRLTFPLGSFFGNDYASDVYRIYDETYDALGNNLSTLCAYGSRTIIDIIVTHLADDRGSFPDKIKRLAASNVITTAQASSITAAFDAGSASAHRGWCPQEADVLILLDVAEMLINQFVINPARQQHTAEATTNLSARVPPRPKKPKSATSAPTSPSAPTTTDLT